MFPYDVWLAVLNPVSFWMLVLTFCTLATEWISLVPDPLAPGNLARSRAWGSADGFRY
jgi:hypothetical protein